VTGDARNAALIALERIGARRSTKELFEKAEFLSRVRNTYFSAREAKSCFLIDALKSEGAVAKEINSIIDKYLSR
jgi:thymidylate kinase